MPGPTRAMLAAGLVATAGLLGACNDDGRALAPAPSTTAPPESAPPTVPGAGTLELTLSSPFLVDDGVLPEDFTCDGVNVHPELTIAGAPQGAAELAVTLRQVGEPRSVHWVMTGLPATTTRIESGVVPAGAVFGGSSTGIPGWDGPCPDPAGDAQEYDFVVYAFAEPVGLTPGLPGGQAIRLLEESAIATDTLTVRYP